MRETAIAVATDATDEEQVIALFERAEATGPVDLAIYDAGKSTGKKSCVFGTSDN